MVEINGDNTFYPNHVTFWVFADAYHLLSDAPFHPISFFLEGLRMSLWVLLICMPTRGFFNPLLGIFYINISKNLENLPTSASIISKILVEMWTINYTISPQMSWSFQNTPNVCFSSFPKKIGIRGFFSPKYLLRQLFWCWKIPWCQFL